MIDEVQKPDILNTNEVETLDFVHSLVYKSSNSRGEGWFSR